MKKIINISIFKGEKYYVAECNDLSIVTQGLTIDETIENVKEALSLHFEDATPADFGLADSPAVLVNYDLGEFAYA